MSLIRPVILSGGSGTRLWPASRSMYPKQLLPMVSERTMLQETALRTSGARNICSRPIVVCNDFHRFLVAEQLRAINVEADIILEPEGRSTAPAAALAAMHAIACNDDDSDDVLLLIMPADHVIRDPAAFLDALAVGEVAARSGALVTLGVVPTYAHTGYGYIEADKAPGTVAPVRSFVEKPDADTAVEMVESGRFFWNAGIFLFSANAWLEELDKYRLFFVLSLFLFFLFIELEARVVKLFRQ